MVDQVACVTFTTPASNSVLPITSPDITEPFSAAILIFTRQTTDDSNVNHGVLGIGFIGVDGDTGTQTLQCSIAIQSENGVPSGQENNTDRDATVALNACNGAAVGTAQIVAVYSASIAGGVSLSFTTTTVQAKCTAILFAGLSKAAVGQCTFDDVAIDHENVGLSPFWQPDILIFRSSDNVVGSDTVNGTLALGFAVRATPIQQVAAYINLDNGNDLTDSDGYVSTSNCSVGFSGTTRTWPDRFHVTSFDSTGFNAIAVDDPGAGTRSPQANYLALKWSGTPQVFAGNAQLSGSATVQSIGSVGFQPSVVFGMSTLIAVEDTLTDGPTASSAGHFAFTPSYQRAYSIHNEEGLNLNPTVSSAHTHQGDYAVLTLTHTGTIAQKATLSSMTSTGFDLNFSTATAGYLTFLALGFVTDETLVVSETVEISDSLGFAAPLVVSDTVTITDEGPDFVTQDVTDTGGPAGWTYGAGAERGCSFAGGAEAGVIL